MQRKALNIAREKIKDGERTSSNIISTIKEIIESEKLARIDYIEVVDSFSMEGVDTIEKSVLVAIAVFIGKTRLIDNFTYEL